MTKFAQTNTLAGMKQIILLVIYMAISEQMLFAQKMRDVFANMPDSVLVLMTKNNRLDCIDFIENHMQARVRNRFDGFSELKQLTDDYLELCLTPSCKIEMKLLPSKDSLSYICISRTYSGPLKESTLAVYTSEWKEIPRHKWLPEIDCQKFWDKKSTVDTEALETLRKQQNIHFVQASLQPDKPILTLTLSPEVTTEEENKQTSALSRPLSYRWENLRFIEIPPSTLDVAP